MFVASRRTGLAQVAGRDWSRRSVYAYNESTDGADVKLLSMSANDRSATDSRLAMRKNDKLLAPSLNQRRDAPFLS